MILNGDEFVAKWSVNGEELYNAGVYDQAVNMIASYDKVVEIGCGTGHSTLALLCGGHKVFAIDMTLECIKTAKELIADIGCEVIDSVRWSEEEATLMCTNLFTEYFVNKMVEFDYDVLVLWNPGQGDKTKIIKQCMLIANVKRVPLQIMERASTPEEAEELLKGNATLYRMKLKSSLIVPIKWNNEDGIRMKNENDTVIDTVYMAIGLYLPSL